MNIDFSKNNGLVPAIIQNDETGEVLMLGYMNRDAAERTETTKRATFWSRSRQALWEKGETSGNSLSVVSMTPDCDGDTILVKARPSGPTCHTGSRSCFGPDASGRWTTLHDLEAIIRERKENRPDGSGTARLFDEGALRIAQKVGEEAVETILAASVHDRSSTVSEAADLLYHLSVLLTAEGIAWTDIENELRSRMPAAGSAGA